MNTRLAILITLTALVARGDTFEERYGLNGQKPKPAARPPTIQAALQGMPYTPYRKLNGHFYDLTPVYNWIVGGRRGVRPMQEWFGESIESHVITSYNVFDVLPGLLLVRGQSFGPSGAFPIGAPFALTNYPFQSKVIDNEAIQFLALRSGNFQYQTANGGMSTVSLYDYGIGYDPWLKARTNGAPSITNGIPKSAAKPAP